MREAAGGRPKTLNKSPGGVLFKPRYPMEKVETVSEMRALAARLKSGKGVLSLVPTMGALHAGHEALLRAAVAEGAPVVASIFVNPLSFGTNENFAGYPRSLDADVAMCERLGVAAVFAPSPAEIYPKGFSTYVSEEAYSKALCGISRPSHFRGRDDPCRQALQYHLPEPNLPRPEGRPARRRPAQDGRRPELQRGGLRRSDGAGGGRARRGGPQFAP